MTDYTGFKEIGVSLDGMVATVEMRRPPHNFFDSLLIAEIGEAFERLDADPACRTIVLAAEGRSFCAGADFSKRVDTGMKRIATRKRFFIFTKNMAKVVSSTCAACLPSQSGTSKNASCWWRGIVWE